MKDVPFDSLKSTHGIYNDPSGVHVSYEAMATVFELFIFHEDKTYAHQAAWAAIEKLIALEQEQSRFIENSDISAINNLKAGDTLRVTPDTFDCLQKANELYLLTEGAFDISIGAVKDCWIKDGKEQSPTKQEIKSALAVTGMESLKLDPENLMVGVTKENIAFDLGGIAKGYAVDKMREVLQDWSIQNALINGGGSSISAMDVPESYPCWPVNLKFLYSGKTLQTIPLKNMSLGSSGIYKGRHIIKPDTGMPVEMYKSCWVLAGKCVVTDALSTAFMIMTDQQIESVCNKRPELKVKLAVLNKDAPETIDSIKFWNWNNH